MESERWHLTWEALIGLKKRRVWITAWYSRLFPSSAATDSESHTVWKPLIPGYLWRKKNPLPSFKAFSSHRDAACYFRCTGVHRRWDEVWGLRDEGMKQWEEGGWGEKSMSWTDGWRSVMMDRCQPADGRREVTGESRLWVGEQFLWMLGISGLCPRGSCS